MPLGQRASTNFVPVELPLPVSLPITLQVAVPSMFTLQVEVETVATTHLSPSIAKVGGALATPPVTVPATSYAVPVLDGVASAMPFI